MLKVNLLMLLLMFCASSMAQSDTTKIYVGSSIGPVFKLNDKELKPKELLEIVSSNPNALTKMERARKNYTASTVLGIIGGFGLGYGGLGPIAGGREVNEQLIAFGAFFTLTSIPFVIAYGKRAKEAVAIYNGDLTSANIIKYNYTFSFNGSSVGLRMNF